MVKMSYIGVFGLHRKHFLKKFLKKGLLLKEEIIFFACYL